MAGDRVIIGSEQDDTKKIELDRLNGKVLLPVSLYGPNGTIIQPESSLITAPFDTVTLSYDSNSNITKAVYSLAGVIGTTLTLTYDANNNLLTVVKT